MSEFTPTLSYFRAVYGAMCADWCRDGSLAEFDRFIAKVKADALREAGQEILPPYNCELNFDGTEDKRMAIYVEAVGEVHAQLEDIAKRIEGEA